MRGQQQRWGLRLLTIAVALVLAGCGASPEPQFSFNMQGLDPANFEVYGDEEDATAEYKELVIAGREDIVTALTAMFGTPDEPHVFPESGLDLAKIEMAAGPAFEPTGRQRGLYREHCVHCHGITGDGAGPTAAFLNPYPRDYRRGVFKFKSTTLNAKPTQADMMRILRDGIHGTAMPSFMLLPNDELEALVEYVKYLSIRGQCEQMLIMSVYTDEQPIELTYDYLANQVLKPIADEWANAESEVITPPDPPDTSDPAAWEASVAEGSKLFHGSVAQCTKCHGPTGLGDGETLLDVWNDPKSKQPELADTYLLPIQQLKPRNLRMGIYRFGRTPADLYRRVAAGIAGTPMPAGRLQPNEIWHLVNYVRSLPYEPMSQPYGPLPNDTPGSGHSETALRARN